MALLGKKSVAGKLPVSDGLLNVVELAAGEEWAIEWNVQGVITSLMRCR